MSENFLAILCTWGAAIAFHFYQKYLDKLYINEVHKYNAFLKNEIPKTKWELNWAKYEINKLYHQKKFALCAKWFFLIGGFYSIYLRFILPNLG